MTPMTIESFGESLLKSGDLDPVYMAINNAKLDRDTKDRLFLAYVCFYHLGAAAKLAEMKKPGAFWLGMAQAAKYSPPRAAPGDQPWPRGAERRHFRGEQSIRGVGELIVKYRTPSDAVMGLVGPQTTLNGRTYKSVAKAAQSHRGFGEWIAFKIADMSERVLGFDVNFDDCHLGIYKDPRQGAAVALYQGHLEKKEVIGLYKDRPWDYPINDQELEDMVTHYVWHFRKFNAPGGRVRKVNVQEVETIFCKYKSHLKGHYPLGKDTREIRHGLEGWGDLAQELSRGLPK